MYDFENEILLLRRTKMGMLTLPILVEQVYRILLTQKSTQKVKAKKMLLIIEKFTAFDTDIIKILNEKIEKNKCEH
jgi:hypothetical protein